MISFTHSPLTSFRLLRLLIHKETIMSAELDALSSVIAAAIAVNQSAASLIPLLSASGAADKTKMTELASQLSSASDALNEVVKENTPPPSA